MTAFNFHITFVMALFGLNDIVTRFPEDHYGTLDGGCAYVEKAEGQRLVPSCIVGQFFSDLGLLRLLINPGAAGVVFTAQVGGETCSMRNEGALGPELRTRLEGYGVTMDDNAHRLLWYTQIEQDAGEPWPVALEMALTRMQRENLITVPEAPVRDRALAHFSA